jgi:hypothetical protein
MPTWGRQFFQAAGQPVHAKVQEGRRARCSHAQQLPRVAEQAEDTVSCVKRACINLLQPAEAQHRTGQQVL